MHSPTPRSKPEMLRRWLRGEFGNRTRAWMSPDELECELASGNPLIDGTVAVRSLTASSAKCAYDIEPQQVRKIVKDFGLSPGEYYLNECMPPNIVTLNAEVCECSATMPGLYLRHSELPVHMRTGMKFDKHAVGITALSLLKKHLDASSYDDLFTMLEIYSGVTIELSCLRKNIGSVPHRNTIFWEVRGY